MGRRPQGYVYQRRSDGRWVAEITIKGQRHYEYAATEDDAYALLAELRRLALSPAATPPRDQTLTVAAFAEQWLASASLSPSTEEHYREMLRRHVLPKIGATPLDQVKPQDIAQVIAAGKAKGPRIAEKAYVVSHRLFQVATEWGIIGDNPAARLSRPKVEAAPRIVWTREEVAAFTDAMLADPGQWGDLFVVVLYTGLRTSEALGLDSGDIRLAHRSLTVQRGLIELQGRRFVTRETKSRASRRSVSLPDQAIRALLHRGGFSGPVFRYEDGRPPSRSALRSALVWASKRAGVPYIGMHGLRHQHCTMLAWAGVPIKVAQERMGHSSPLITLSVYMHALPEDHLLASELLDRLFEAG